MWFNFRQMSYNSQIILSSQTNIKLEEDAMARNSPQLQQMREGLLRDQEKKEDIEFITPDAVNNGENNVKVEEDETEEMYHTEDGFDAESFTKQDKCTIKSNEEELERTEEESNSCADVEVNECIKSQDELNRNYAEEDCLAEICIEEALLKGACNEEYVEDFRECKQKRFTESHASLEESIDVDNEEIPADEDIADEESNKENEMQHNLASSELDSNVGTEENVDRAEEEIDDSAKLLCEEDNAGNLCNVNNDNDLDSNSKDDNDSNFETLQTTKVSSDSSVCSKDIERDINFLLDESDRDDIGDIPYKLKGKRQTRQQTKSKKPVGRKKNTDMEALRCNNISPTRTKDKLNATDKYICSVCGNILTDYVLFTRHVKTHSKKKQHACE